MQEYYFLFALALTYTLFATIQDLRTREVANWLTFSLITFGLAYRAFYASHSGNVWFFLYGLLGFIVMYIFGNALYYLKAFAGGDAKLLMGLGIILPIQTPLQSIAYPLYFTFVLFLSGAIWSLLYSFIIVKKNKKKFSKEFKKSYNKLKPLFWISSLLFTISLVASIFYPFLLFAALISLTPLLFIYTKSLEKSMISLIPPNKLAEGDWLQKNIKLPNGKIITKSVHGLSYKEIQLLKKYHRAALIKEGIPFVPAFLITTLLMVLSSATSLLQFPKIFSFLF